MQLHYRLTAVLLGSLLLFKTAIQAQDLAQLAQKKPKDLLKGGVQVTGSLSAQHIFYTVSGIEQRRDPFNFFYTGNLNVNLFGKINMPVAFTFSNQNLTFPILSTRSCATLSHSIGWCCGRPTKGSHYTSGRVP
jgi:hypothetical protein